MLITLCVTAAITVGLYVNDLIKKSRDKTLELARSDLLEDITVSKNEILAVAETSHFDIAARIYIMFSAHCINLYKDIDNLTPGTYKYNMYMSYLDIAVSMAKYGYVYASDMQKTLEKRNVDATDDQKMLMWKAINNYIFYLSQTGRPDDDITVSETMPKLLEIIAEMRNKPGEWHFQDTLAWANLYLKVNSTMQTQAIIQSLLNRNDIDQQWKIETKERYDLYNRVQSHARPGYADQIILTVP